MKRIEQLLLLQNSLCIILAAIVLCGTSSPILFQLLSKRDVSIGAPFFNSFFIPLIFCVLILLFYVHGKNNRFLKGRNNKTLTIILVLFHFILFFTAGFSVTESFYCVICFALWCTFLL